MNKRGAQGLWLLACVGPVMLIGLGVGAIVVDAQLPNRTEFIENIYPDIVFGILLPLLGALILTRLPGHTIGWLFLGAGLASAATLPFYGYARLALYDYPGQLPAGVAAAWVSSWLWALGFMPLVTIAVLTFPDGQVPGRRWRVLLWLDIVAVCLIVCAMAFKPGPLENHPIADNPLGLPLPVELFNVLAAFGFGFFLVGLVGGTGSAVLRWRRAPGAERAQLNWFALAVVLLLFSVALPDPKALAQTVSLVAVPLLPVSVAVAILRRHLYGIDVVIRRSLVYAVLTGVLLLAYAVTVVILGGLLEDRADAAVALVATALVAIAFAPLRERLQRAADRLLYGDRDDPYAVLTGVGRRLDEATTATWDGLAEVAETVASSLRLPYTRVEVFEPTAPEEVLTAQFGEPKAELHEVPISFRGVPVGRLVVAPRTARDPFREADLRLLNDLGRQIGVAARALLLGRALQQSREVLVATREEERRRMRRDLHDGLGPALAGVALGLDAVQLLVTNDPEAAATLAGQLHKEIQGSLADVRRLVENLRPPALDQLGLVAAVRQQADRLTERHRGLEVAVEADDVPTLPAAVEVAAYRIATEALTNVSRHAAARHCRVEITMDSGQALVVEIVDDGVGIPLQPRAGIGLSAMRERAVELGGTCETVDAPGGGTRVQARLPVVA